MSLNPILNKNIFITLDAAASSGTWGFSAGVSLDVKGSQTTSNSQDTKSLTSNLMGNKLADYTQFGLNNYYTDTSLANTNTKKEPQSALEYIQLQKNNDKFAVLDKSEGKNAIYLYKSRVVATDGVNDKKVIDLTDKEVFTQMMYNSYRKDEIKHIDQQDTSKFENVYYLDNKDGFEILRAATEQTYIGISPNTKIVFQNGMNTDQASMNQNLNLFKQDFTNVGSIHNDSGEYGIISDIFEWKPNYLTTKDVLNAEILQRLSPNTLVVTHSAGNSDIKKANQVNSLVNAQTPYYLISVGSPKSATDLKESTKSVGATFVNQINHSNDPVANGWLNEDANYKFNLKEPFKHSFETYYPYVKQELDKRDE